MEQLATGSSMLPREQTELFATAPNNRSLLDRKSLPLYSKNIIITGLPCATTQNKAIMYLIARQPHNSRLLCKRIWFQNLHQRRPQWPRGLRRGSAAASVLGLRVRIPLGASMSVLSHKCCQGRGLCIVLITRPEESYRVWCV